MRKACFQVMPKACFQVMARRPVLSRSCRRRASSTTRVTGPLRANQTLRFLLPKVRHIFGDPCRRLLHLRTRSFFLTPALRRCQLQITGRGCLLDNRGAVAGSRRPHRRDPLEGLAAFRASRPGGCLPAPALGDFRPCPHFGVRHSPAAPHVGIIVGRLIRSTEAGGATHDIAAARPTAIGQGLLDLGHPTMASFQAPAAAAQGVGSKRPVLAATDAE